MLKETLNCVEDQLMIDIQNSLREAKAAIELIKEKVRWKPEKGKSHLEKRKALGHLPKDSSLKNYNNLIKKIVKNYDNLVYLYKFGADHYYAVRGNIQDTDWLVIFGKDGLMETAFPPRNIEDYINSRGFKPIGRIEEVVN